MFCPKRNYFAGSSIFSFFLTGRATNPVAPSFVTEIEYGFLTGSERLSFRGINFDGKLIEFSSHDSHCDHAGRCVRVQIPEVRDDNREGFDTTCTCKKLHASF